MALKRQVPVVDEFAAEIRKMDLETITVLLAGGFGLLGNLAAAYISAKWPQDIFIGFLCFWLLVIVAILWIRRRKLLPESKPTRLRK